MLYQLENGSLLNIEGLEDIESLLTSDQLDMVTALLSISESTIEDLESTIEDLESTIDANDILAKNIIRYIERYGVKNESKLREKISKLRK